MHFLYIYLEAYYSNYFTFEVPVQLPVPTLLHVDPLFVQLPLPVFVVSFAYNETVPYVFLFFLTNAFAFILYTTSLSLCGYFFVFYNIITTVLCYYHFSD